jgi:hypothetical protein
MDCGDENALGSPLMSAVFPSSRHLAYVNQLKGSVASKRYHYHFSFERNGWTTDGDIGVGKRKSVRRIQRDSVLAIYCGASMVSAAVLPPLYRPDAACAMAIRLSTSRSSTVTGNSLT